jgi:hypothetical protein
MLEVRWSLRFLQAYQNMIRKTADQITVSEACDRQGPFFSNGGLKDD